MRIFVFALLLIVPLVRAENTIITTNICDVEKKNISCSSDSVIYIDSARYGRMTDACLTGYSHLNCSADMRLYLERKCAGRRSCLLERDSVLTRSNHRCPAELKTHLEVRHHCLRVETPRNADSSKCNKYSVDIATPHGYLARIVTVETRIGSSTCPWSIEAKSGQTIRLTLYDFGIWHDPETTTPAPGDNHEARPMCHIYATINERAGSAGARPVCGGVLGNLRQVDGGRVVYTSNSNSVQVAVTTTANPTLEQFLLKYEVVGCADPGPLPQMSVERISDRLVIKCSKDNTLDSEPKTWTIQCLDAGNWSMPLNELNCSTAKGFKYKTSSYFAGSGLLLTIAISATVIVAVLVITCGLFILYRRRVAREEEESQVPLPAGGYRFIPTTAPTSGYGSWAPTEGVPYTPGAPIVPWPPGLERRPSADCLEAPTSVYDLWAQTEGAPYTPGAPIDSWAPVVVPWPPGLERRPSADCLERDYATTLQMRLNAMPCSASTPSSSHHVSHSGVAGPYGLLPYDHRTMMVYCPFHGTLTRVNEEEPARLAPTCSTESTDADIVGDEEAWNHEQPQQQERHPLQRQPSDLYSELNF